MKHKLCMSLAFILLLDGNAVAAEVCELDGDHQTMNACADQRFQAADKELNDVWKKLMAITAGDDMADVNKRLVKAQKSWLSYRDAMCAVVYKQGDIGSMLPMLYSLCLARLTKTQTKELQAVCEDGTIACE